MRSEHCYGQAEITVSPPQHHKDRTIGIKVLQADADEHQRQRVHTPTQIEINKTAAISKHNDNRRTEIEINLR